MDNGKRKHATEIVMVDETFAGIIEPFREAVVRVGMSCPQLILMPQ